MKLAELKLAMPYQMTSSIFDLVLCISDAVDLVSPYVAAHHRRVAYLALRLGQQYGLSLQRCKDLVIAAALHDVGALSLHERLELLNFETEKTLEHSEIGYLLISGLKPFAAAADIIRFHHLDWAAGAGQKLMGIQVPIESHILHLADRVSVLIDPRREVLSQAPNILQRIQQKSGRVFMPDVVDAFARLASKDYIWFDLAASNVDVSGSYDLDWDSISLDGNEFLELAQFFCRIVDFKSPFTATHSSGVAACARVLAEMAGFSPLDQRLLYISGFLHDIGKLCVPSEILEKPAALSGEESAVMRHHSYYTNHILQRIGVFDNVRIWSAYHHERLDGSGYPYHLKSDDLPPGARLIAVADVFTALMENRPYRLGMNKADGLRVMQDMVQTGLLDTRLVNLISNRFDQVRAQVLGVESDAAQDYQHFTDRFTQYMQLANGIAS